MGNRTALALASLGISIVLIAQDFSALNVALPSIERDLDTDLTTVQWVINAYALAFAVLMVTGGRLADQFGRRTIFLVGAAIFAVTSLLAGLAPGPLPLIGARALMGIGGALMWPAVLGMAFAVLPPQKAGLAGSLVIGAAGIGQAIGPISGGALTEFLSWRWVHFVNVPITLVAMAGIWFAIAPQAAPGRGEPVDVPGIVALSTALVALLFALDQATDWGWTDPRILLALAVTVLGLIVFVPLERRAGEHALVPLAVMRTRAFATACVLIALVAPAFTAVLLYLPQLMEKLLAFSPLQAGIGMLPLLGAFAVVSFAAAPLAAHLGTKPVIVAGAACMAVGPWLLSGFGIGSAFNALIPGMVVTGIGLGLVYPTITTAGVTAIDPARASLAGGIIYMFQLAGGAIGLGLTTTIVASSTQAAVRAAVADLPVVEVDDLRGLLAGTESAQAAVQGLDAAAAQQILATAGEAFAAGVRAGLRVDAALSAVAVVLAIVLLRGSERTAPAQTDRPARANG
jgi:EmrB/QacA subfamily drug resistance transporter